MIRRVEQQWVPLVRSAGFIAVLLTAGCAGMDRAPQEEPAKPEVTQDRAQEPEQPAARERRVRAKPAPPPAAPPATVSTSQGAVKPETPVAKPEAPAAKPETPAAKPAAKALASPAPKTESAAPPAPKAPPLDLAALEKRLKETSAIGVFTKLTLKNQVDALLEKFRGYYQGRIKTTLDQLRQPYDQLLMKVLSLLQDSDPPLARDIVQSREAIWGILSDPKKFHEL
jgi:outer membrane biosynthesis protein TonB